MLLLRLFVLIIDVMIIIDSVIMIVWFMFCMIDGSVFGNCILYSSCYGV